MPAITIATPFNFSLGAVTHYKKGEQDVPQAVAEHAKARGYLANAKPAAPAKTSFGSSPESLNSFVE